MESELFANAADAMTPDKADTALKPPSVAWPHAKVSMVDALMLASQVAYGSFFAAIEHARLGGKAQVTLHDPKTFRVGRYAFHWSVFVHGVRAQGRRDRSHWTDRGLLVPFEQLRRVLAQKGIYVVLSYEPRPVVRVFDRSHVATDPDFTTVDINGQEQRVYKHNPARRNFYNVVPF
tara:strand:- start:104 stop:634 length:531 start_codon:yes stop_codon:yes gene_type:complete